MKSRISSCRIVEFVAFTLLLAPSIASARDQWTKEQANAWYAGMPWLVGCNYIPSTAINQLEMWQADTFDPATIDRELGWAEGLGFNSVRVFLHHLLWEQDREGFLKRMEQFLDDRRPAQDRRDVRPVRRRLGSQSQARQAASSQAARAQFGLGPEPGRGDPRRTPSRHDALKGYVQGVIGQFRADRRVHAWDLFNEPDNTNGSSYGKLEPTDKPELSLTLLKKVFAWAREVDPSQPLTSGVWAGDWSPDKLSPMNRFQLDASDVISFHNYNPLPQLKTRIEPLKRYGRPMLCTEYMARPEGSTFEPVLAYLSEQKIGAYNWGFVAGKTQTIYPWDSWQEDLHRRAPRLVPRHLPEGWHARTTRTRSP